MNKTSYKKYHRDSDYIENENLFKNIFMKRYLLIDRYIKNGKRVLEIGCSNGVFLDIYKENGWETFGVEPSKNGIVAQNRGHKVYRDIFENVSLPKKYFDLVIMNHTLEHVKDANFVLEKINSILKTDGILFIDVPNAGGFLSKIMGDKWPHRLPLEHNYQFTKNSLTKYIINNKFKVLHWESRSGLFEFANPLSELWQSFSGFKKRFFEDILGFPYSLFVTAINMGDSMSIIARKK